MRNIKRGLWLIAVGVWLLAFSVRAEEVYPEKEWVWGCQIRGRAINGDCVMRGFTKVGEADPDVDTDEEQILGFEPGNVPVTRDGQPVFSRIKTERFLRPGEIRLIPGAKCSCRR